MATGSFVSMRASRNRSKVVEGVTHGQAALFREWAP
jgi:hypothetical protein